MIRGVAVIALLVSPVAFGGGRAPTDVELHTAYCIPIVEWELKGLFGFTLKDKPSDDPTTIKFNQAWREEKAHLESVLDRMQSYLNPKIRSLDSTALALAAKRAAADMEASNDVSNQCIALCKSEADDKVKACNINCTNNHPGKSTNDRIDACLDPTWLPF